MGMATSLRDYLQEMDVDYELLHHSHTSTSMMSAEESHIPGDQLAKGVILGDEEGYVMAIVPSTHRIELGRISEQLHRRLGLASEDEISALFQDCDLGAIPPLGQPYGLEMIVDEGLSKCPDIYFEAGDHTDLVHVSGHVFHDMMDHSGARFARFSHHI